MVPRIALFSTVMSSLPTNDPNPDILHLVIDHIFMPPKLPQEDPGEEVEQGVNVVLCNNLIQAAQDFLPVVSTSERPLWMHMIKMMELARCAAEGPFAEAELQRVFSNMAIGGLSI